MAAPVVAVAALDSFVHNSSDTAVLHGFTDLMCSLP